MKEVVGDQYNLSPRFHIAGINTDFAGSEQDFYIMALDFAKENEIDLGTQFPFQSLEDGECLLSQVHEKKYALQVGQTVELTFSEPNLW